MTEFLARLRQGKLAQWALAYLAAAWVVLQVLELVAASFHWPDAVMHLALGLLALGLAVTLLLAWYHGERGLQGVSGTELLIIALVLAVGGAWLWRIQPDPQAARSAPAAAMHDGMPPRASPASIATLPAHATRPASVTPAKSIAVLPFENLSTDEDNAYFADGMQDLILTRLAGIGELKVISRTSTEQFKSRPEDLKSIGEQLGVATILEGSVQKAGNQVLITVQLIDARTDHHIWAESYQRTLDNIFGVEGEVAGRIAAALEARLTTPEASAVTLVPTTNPQAYDNYLRGLNFMRLADKGDWTGNVPQAIAAFKAATVADSGFALAWAWVSIARAHAVYWNVDRSVANLQAEEQEARRALALAPQSSAAHRAMGHVQRFVHHDLVAARAEFQKSVDLSPNDTDALGSLAIIDWNLGNLDAAIKGFRQVIALNPRDSAGYDSLGNVLAIAGDFSGARQALQRAVMIDPQRLRGYLSLSRFELFRNGDVEAATRVLDNMAPGTPVNEQVASIRVGLLVLQRRFTDARALAKKYAGTFTTGPAAIDMAFVQAMIERLAGNPEGAETFYHAAIKLVKQPGHDISHLDLAMAYAWLGEEKAARREFATAKADKRWSQAGDGEYQLMTLANFQLALGQNAAAIDYLGQFMAACEKQGKPMRWVSPALLRMDPFWDQVRDDPRFQALLKRYAGYQPAYRRPEPPASATSAPETVISRAGR